MPRSRSSVGAPSVRRKTTGFQSPFCSALPLTTSRWMQSASRLSASPIAVMPLACRLGNWKLVSSVSGVSWRAAVEGDDGEVSGFERVRVLHQRGEHDLQAVAHGFDGFAVHRAGGINEEVNGEASHGVFLGFVRTCLAFLREASADTDWLHGKARNAGNSGTIAKFRNAAVWSRCVGGVRARDTKQVLR